MTDCTFEPLPSSLWERKVLCRTVATCSLNGDMCASCDGDVGNYHFQTFLRSERLHFSEGKDNPK